MDEQTVARFLGQIAMQANGCWLWTGCSARGYGRFHHDGTEEKAHRFSYRYFIGALPAYTPTDGELDHLCRNRGCVNPTHLELVPHRVNIRRGRSGYQPRSAESVAKSAAAIRGRKLPWTPEWKAALAASRRTESCRAKMRAAWARRKARAA